MKTNQTRAVQLFERATERGSWRAPYQLMVIFGEGGWGDVPANLTRAVAAYREWTSHLPHWGEVLHKATAAMEEGACWVEGREALGSGKWGVPQKCCRSAQPLCQLCLPCQGGAGPGNNPLLSGKELMS